MEIKFVNLPDQNEASLVQKYLASFVYYQLDYNYLTFGDIFVKMC